MDQLSDIGLGAQSDVGLISHAIQCRITTEDPANDFMPDTGTITTYRTAEGNGIRLDGEILFISLPLLRSILCSVRILLTILTHSPPHMFFIYFKKGVGFAGARISPHYDSMLVKITASAKTFPQAVAKQVRWEARLITATFHFYIYANPAHTSSFNSRASSPVEHHFRLPTSDFRLAQLRALKEFRIRGVKTNIPYLQNVLSDPEFTSGPVTTAYIEDHPEMLEPAKGSSHGNRATKLLRYLANLKVNGHPTELGADIVNNPPSIVDPVAPTAPAGPPPDGWKQVLEREGEFDCACLPFF